MGAVLTLLERSSIMNKTSFLRLTSTEFGIHINLMDLNNIEPKLAVLTLSLVSSRNMKIYSSIW